MKTLATLAALAALAVPSFACDTCGCKDKDHDHSSGKAHKHDIVDTAVEAEGFGTLVTAVKAADLVKVLKGEGPFTVFAPNDEAFAKIPAKDLKAVLADKEKLTAVLTFHVVPGKVMAADVVKLTEAETVNGKKAKIVVKDGTVTVAGAKVIATDIECTNGVIHVIDTVMLP